VDSTLLRLRAWLSLRGRAHTARERSLEAVEPFPGLVGAKSSKEGKAHSRRDHTDPPTGVVLSTTSLTPHPRPIQGGRFVRCKSSEARSTDDRSLRAESGHTPTPSHTTRRLGERPDRIFPRQRSPVTNRLAPAKTHRGGTHPERTLGTHRDLPHLILSPEYHP
jgi:hypothetical protein